MKKKIKSKYSKSLIVNIFFLQKKNYFLQKKMTSPYDYTYSDIQKTLAAGEAIIVQAGMRTDLISGGTGNRDSTFKKKDSIFYNSADFKFYKKAIIETTDGAAGDILANISCLATPEDGYFYLAKDGENFKLGKAGNTNKCKVHFEYLTSAGEFDKEITVTPTGGDLLCSKVLFGVDATVIHGACYIDVPELYKLTGLDDVAFYEVDPSFNCKVTYDPLSKTVL